MPSGPLTISYVGHATVGIEIDGMRILTDPILRRRVTHLYRYGPPPDPSWLRGIDAVLISHLHLDHCDIPSLRRLGDDVRLVVPAGAAPLLRRRGFLRVEEMAPGEEMTIGSIRLQATPAAHSGFRPPSGPSAVAVGYLLSAGRTVYFAGDTNLFPEMADLGAGLDVALIPIWGWGRRLGPGHLDPRRAAEALELLHPGLAIPIHWGTFARPGLGGPTSPFFTDPPRLFAEYARELAPEVAVRIVSPGQSVRMLSDANGSSE